MTTIMFKDLPFSFPIDHHCPWINNCVGHFNHGHFIRFLFFVDIACLYHLVMVTKRVLYASKDGYWVRSIFFRMQNFNQK